jgi:hypothetical protein
LPTDALWSRLDEQILTATATSITFSGIAATVTLLRLTCWVSEQDAPTLRLNNDSGANYEYQRIHVSNTTLTGARATAQTAIPLTNETDDPEVQAFIEIGKHLATEEAQVAVFSGQRSPGHLVEAYAGQWNNTADLVNRVDILGASIKAGTVVLLEGAAP